MARLARMIRDVVREAFEEGEASDNLRDLYTAFQETLLPELREAEFADMFAQTLACGLFAARYNHTGSQPFSRAEAAREIPRASPFPRALFATIAGPGLDDEPFMGLVDDLIQMLALADMDEICADFGKATRQEDPLVYFYETFLSQYDPELRELRGVYYTPEPVVAYIVRSVDHLLHAYFACADGLADTGTVPCAYEDEHGERRAGRSPRVLILDPATGTGAFLSKVIQLIREKHRAMHNAGTWSDYAREHLLPRLFGFELLMAPYALAHLKLGMQLAAPDLSTAERANQAHDFESNERLSIYLTNTLDEALKRCQMMFGRSIPDEANEDARVRQGYPVMVVLGNPPYSGHSANKGQWISGLLDTYKAGCSDLEKPAQAKWLSDDYVKFIRFAQWRIEQTGYGIVAFITNHSYLDNPTFRGMRHSLLQSFDDIYVLDLHGNAKKQERAPDGSRDENIFDIQQGVAIGIFVKHKKPGKSAYATVHHADLWGLREVLAKKDSREGEPVAGKYPWLSEHDIASTSWDIVKPREPFYLFKPQDRAYIVEYEQGWKIPDIFKPHGDPAPGMVTTQDDFAISWTREAAIAKVESLVATHTEAEARELFRLCAQDQWQYAPARQELSKNQWRDELVEVLYRPFDVRWTVFNRYVAVHRRERVTRHMLAGENMGITLGRAGQVIEQDGWTILFCTRHITDFNLYRRGGNNLFPLYLYPDPEHASLSAEDTPIDAPGGRRPNLAEAFTRDCAEKLRLRFIQDGQGDLQQSFGPEDIFDYMYAVFHSPTYRARYAGFLKIDFPRLPLTSSPDLFRVLCGLGERLVGLHLMEQIGQVATSYPEAGNDMVEKIAYTCPANEPEKGRIWINQTQHFAGVPREVWEFQVGGYRVCAKWLKDRKGRRLEFNDIQHYQRVVAALGETIALMERIDEAIEERGGWPIE